MTSITIPIIKIYTKRVLYSFEPFKRRVYLVGDEQLKEKFRQEFQLNPYLGQIYTEKGYELVFIISKGFSTERLDTLIQKYMDSGNGVYIIPYMTNIHFAYSTIMDYSNIQANSIYIEI